MQKCAACKCMCELSQFENQLKTCNMCREYTKRWRAEHKKELANKKKQYAEINKAAIKEYKGEYYIKNKEEIKKKRALNNQLNKEGQSLRRHLSYLKNKDNILARCKEYAKNNSDAISKRSKKYREENKIRLKESKKIYYDKNVEILRQKSLAWYYGNRERARKRASGYMRRRRADVGFRIVSALRHRIRHLVVFIKAQKYAKTMDLVGCTMEELKIHLEKLFLPNMTWENYGNKSGQWSIDHIMPCASFNLTDPEQQKICFHYTNLRPLWHIDNIKKGAKYEP